MAQHITAVLLSGGESTRFWPFQDKNTLELFGKSNLQWHYEQLIRVGITECIVVGNNENIDRLSTIPIPSELNVTFTKQAGQGQGEAIYSIRDTISEGPVLILNSSDGYGDLFIESLLDHTRKEKETILLSAVILSSYFPGGYIKTNKQGQVEEIVEKPLKGTEPSNMVRIVADYYPHIDLLLSKIASHGKNSSKGYEQAINELIHAGHVCKAELTEVHNWCPIKYPWHVLTCMERLFPSKQQQHIHPNVEIKKNVVIEGAVIIEEGVKIFEGTKIVGPVYIGKNTIIGNNNIIRHSHIGAFVVTGFSTDITRSYIGDNCWFHTNYIGDSVIGNNVSMGSGTVCANLRLDDEEISSMVKGEKIGTGKNKLGAMLGNNVRIGVNTSIMPGIKIGQNSFVGAGIVVDSDIEDSKFVFFKNGTLTTVDNTKQVAVSRDQFRRAL